MTSRWSGSGGMALGDPCWKSTLAEDYNRAAFWAKRGIAVHHENRQPGGLS